MPPEKQVCSLELAKKLKELGVKQESLFWWCNFGKNDWRGAYFCHELDGEYFTYDGHHDFRDRDLFDKASAFTVAELGEILPDGIATFKRSGNFGWKCLPPRENQHLPCQYADTEADARAKMLIYLLENKLITL